MKVLKFGAVWCSGCLVMRPRWEELENELDWLTTEYHDVDEEKELADTYEITDYPCFIILDDAGNELYRGYGEIETDQIREIVKRFKNA
jgi:thiol-disulfide isomerase/thioredoxin